MAVGYNNNDYTMAAIYILTLLLRSRTSSSMDVSEYTSSGVSQMELRPDELKLELR